MIQPSDDLLDLFGAAAERAIAGLDARKRDESTIERTEQVAAGRCNVRPFPTVATQPFRSELTIEQNSLFVANAFRGEFFTREWGVKHPESGEPVMRRVTLGRTSAKGRIRGVLRQIHQDVFYQLLQRWDNQGYPVIGTHPGKTYGSFSLSAYELVMALRNSHNAREYQRVQDLLRDLASIPIVLENSYTWQGLRDREEFTLLQGVDWKERAIDETTRRPKPGGTSEVTILISSRVTEGFLHRHVMGPSMLNFTPVRRAS